MIVLGIDPGVANTGYGIVAHDRGRLVALDGGVIETPRGAGPGRAAGADPRARGRADGRLPARRGRGRGPLLRRQRALARSPSARRAASSSSPPASARSAARSYTPQQVKAAVCGSGRAGKDQVQRMVQTLLSLPELPKPDHAADALAVAICHANGAPLRGRAGEVAG